MARFGNTGTQVWACICMHVQGGIFFLNKKSSFVFVFVSIYKCRVVFVFVYVQKQACIFFYTSAELYLYLYAGPGCICIYIQCRVAFIIGHTYMYSYWITGVIWLITGFLLMLFF